MPTAAIESSANTRLDAAGTSPDPRKQYEMKPSGDPGAMIGNSLEVAVATVVTSDAATASGVQVNKAELVEGRPNKKAKKGKDGKKKKSKNVEEKKELKSRNVAEVVGHLRDEAQSLEHHQLDLNSPENDINLSSTLVQDQLVNQTSLSTQSTQIHPNESHPLDSQSSADMVTIKKGVLWQQHDHDKFHQRLFSRWKKRFFILTTDYLVCFKRSKSKVGRSEMGKFLYKVSCVCRVLLQTIESAC